MPEAGARPVCGQPEAAVDDRHVGTAVDGDEEDRPDAVRAELVVRRSTGPARTGAVLT